MAAPIELTAVPGVPEIRLFQADPGTGLLDLAGGHYSSDRQLPFWAFAWAGGTAMARHLLDNPELVAGRDVVDLASGSGLVAIAAAMAGARSVTAVDIDPQACSAISRNAEANGVLVCQLAADLFAEELLDHDRRPPWLGGAQVVLAADVFYTATVSAKVCRLLRRLAAEGTAVLAADPDRGFLHDRGFTAIATYDIKVSKVLEGQDNRQTRLWAL